MNQIILCAIVSIIHLIVGTLGVRPTFTYYVSFNNNSNAYSKPQYSGGSSSRVGGQHISSDRIGDQWTNNHGQGLVFVYSKAFDADELETITAAVQEIAKHSCIQVRLFHEDKFMAENTKNGIRNYVFISRSPLGYCHTDIGMMGGKQLMTLDSDSGCTSKIKYPLHEMMHILGYDHEQNRPDRDKYVEIHYENVASGQHNEFDIKSNARAIGPYDFSSIMQYGMYTFSRHPALPTMTSKVKGFTIPITIAENLSSLDKKKIGFITGCKSDLVEYPKIY